MRMDDYPPANKWRFLWLIATTLCLLLSVIGPNMTEVKRIGALILGWQFYVIYCVKGIRGQSR